VPRGIARWGMNGEAAARGRLQGVAKWAKYIYIFFLREKYDYMCSEYLNY